MSVDDPTSQLVKPAVKLVDIPYPPVFHDWRKELAGLEGKMARVATANGDAGVLVEMTMPTLPNGDVPWRQTELTERDACLLAASLLQRAGQDRLCRSVLRTLAREDASADA